MTGCPTMSPTKKRVPGSAELRSSADRRADRGRSLVLGDAYAEVDALPETVAAILDGELGAFQARRSKRAQRARISADPDELLRPICQDIEAVTTCVTFPILQF